MNVTGVEWRDVDPHESHYPAGDRHRRPPKPPEPDDAEDTVEIHGEAEEDQADSLE